MEGKAPESSKRTKKVAMKNASVGFPDENPNPSPSNNPSSSSKKKGAKNADNVTKQRQRTKRSVPPHNARVCKNSACRKIQEEGEKFCRRCSCCICEKYDEEKDTSKWLQCERGGICGLSCHAECALEKNEVGVVYHGPSLQFDGGYRCRFCGKISRIIEFWKKQIVMAKSSRRLNALYYKLSLCCRLLDGSFKFKELHETAKSAKEKLESGIGPTDMDSTGTLHGLVGRLSVAGEVRNLCGIAIGKANELLAHPTKANPVTRDAVNFICHGATDSSVQITVFGMFSGEANKPLRGYKVWHYKAREYSRPQEPPRSIPTTLKTVTITGLDPSTEYAVRVAAYSDEGIEWGHSKASIETKCEELVEIECIHVDPEEEEEKEEKEEKEDSVRAEEQNNATGTGSESTFLKLSSLFHLRMTDERRSSSGEHRSAVDNPDNSGGQDLSTGHHRPPCRGNDVDPNPTNVPDLDKEAVPPHGNGEDNARSDGRERTTDPIKAGEEAKTGSFRGTSRDSKDEADKGNNVVVSNEELPVSLPPPRARNETLGYGINKIRDLERGGHITPEFRTKLLSWYCTRASQDERNTTHLLIDAFMDAPDQLPSQLSYCFPGILGSKKRRLK